MTRIAQAKNGMLTSDFVTVGRGEHTDAELIRQAVAEGTITIIRNNKRSINPVAIGKGARIKVNANIGTSSSKIDIAEEITKMETAIRFGADAIMDLSTAGNLTQIRQELLDRCSVAFGTVPLYEMAFRAREKKKSIVDLTAEEMFEVIESHCSQGVDFLTLHCGVTAQTVHRFKEVKRLAGAVSRGGTLIMEWIYKNKKENPLYEHFDRILDLCSTYDVAVSLGDGFRPGCLHDATDRVQIEELIILGELVDRARKYDVGVFVEGPGHVPLHQIATNIQIEKTLCHGAPFYVLGPLVTDVSLGHDHIAGAIGGAVAGMAGVDFLCYVTPAEHLRLPSIDDVREGTIASKIAAHAADIARGYPVAAMWDYTISKAKKELDWETIFSLCVDPAKARAYRASLPPSQGAEGLCSMCGEFCAMKRSKSVENDQ